jgi:hypothetical protein
MRKLTRKEIERALSQHPAVAPPEGLADAIKAEIPDLATPASAAEAVLARGRQAGLPQRVPTLHWLAAGVLVAACAGFVSFELLRDDDNPTRRIALDGILVPEDLSVLVPARSQFEAALSTRSVVGGAPSQSSSTTAAKAVHEVRVSVHDAAGRPCAGVLISLSDAGMPPAIEHRATLPGNGTIVFRAIESGPYAVTATRGGRNLATRTLRVQGENAGGPVTVALVAPTCK